MLAVIILWIIAETLLLPSLFESAMIVNTRNVILLMSAGVFFGRTMLMWRGIRSVLFTAAVNHRTEKE